MPKSSDLHFLILFVFSSRCPCTCKSIKRKFYHVWHWQITVTGEEFFSLDPNAEDCIIRDIPADDISIDGIPREQITADVMPEEEITADGIPNEEITADGIPNEEITADEPSISEEEARN